MANEEQQAQADDHPAHWTEPPTNDAKLEWRFNDAEALVIGAQNPNGGGGSGFDPRASDSRIVGKLVRDEETTGDRDRDFRLVGRKLIGVRGERSPMTKTREIDVLLHQLSLADRTVLYLAYGPADAVPAFAVELKSVQTKDDVDRVADSTAKSQWRKPPRWLRVTILTAAANKAWEDAGRPKSLAGWLIDKPARLKTPLVQAAKLVFASWNRWADIRGRGMRYQRHRDEADAVAAMESER